MVPEALGLATALMESVVTFAQAAAEGDIGWLLFLGPVGGVIFYGVVYSRYRNTHRSHDFVRETRITAEPVTGNEAKVRDIRGTRSPWIDGDNRTNHRQRVQRG